MTATEDPDVFDPIRKPFKALIHALPAPVRYFLSLIAFWPTALFNRLYCWLMPHKRRLHDRVLPSVILGAVPLSRSQLAHLRDTERVTAVVNLCREWDWHGSWYPTAGMRQLHLPTIDYDVPTLAHCVAGAHFLKEVADRGETAYVHCKAGRGRSTTVVLCYMTMHLGYTPKEAHEALKRIRPQISVRYTAPEVKACYEMGQRMRAQATTSPAGSSSGGGAASAPAAAAAAGASTTAAAAAAAHAADAEAHAAPLDTAAGHPRRRRGSEASRLA